MKMKLELAVVESCAATGCVVAVVGQATKIEARYSAAVLDQIRIRRGDLVAVDLAINPPQLVWRWRHGEVLEPLSEIPAEGHVLAGAHGEAFEAYVPHKELQLAPGDTVWLIHGPRGKEVVDRACNGEPEHAQWIRETYFPLIDAHYAARADG